MPTLRPLLLLLLAALSGPVAAQGERVLRVCMTDTPHEPWRYTVDGRVPKGLDHELLNRFGQRSGWRVALPGFAQNVNMTRVSPSAKGA